MCAYEREGDKVGKRERQAGRVKQKKGKESARRRVIEREREEMRVRKWW